MIRRGAHDLSKVVGTLHQVEGKMPTANADSCVRVEEECHGWTWSLMIALTFPSYFPPASNRGFRTLSMASDSLALLGMSDTAQGICGILIT
jgi:hypothetical protein